MGDSPLDSIAQTVISELISEANGLLATRYLAASGLICVLYDTILTFTRELNLIWRRKTWDMTWFIYVFIKYGNLGSMLYTAYVMAGLRPQLHQQGCKNFFMAMACTALISLGAANGYLTIRLYTLWDHRRPAKIVLFTSFGATYLIVVVMAILTLRFLFGATYYSNIFQTCLVKTKPLYIYGVWSSMTLFDIIAIALAASNGFDQPYRQHVEILSRFKRDGSLYFLAAFVLRLVNLICAVVLSGEFLLITLFFVWSMISITTCRLILRVEEIRRSARPPQYYAYEMNRWKPHNSSSTTA